ncbi:P-loop containing nucleoside triphosphate hydrolase protein [Xylaria castorea]|nr:P-loop containing nucleoside triphosphate hydrolase protein [Xylaria castorea]
MNLSLLLEVGRFEFPYRYIRKGKSLHTQLTTSTSTLSPRKMETKQPVSQGPAEDKPKGPWIRYRVEHRDNLTNKLISHRDTKGPGLDDDGDSSKPHGAAFMLITTYSIGVVLPSSDQSSEESSTQTISTITSPPSYSLHVISPAIVNALRSVVQYYPSQNLAGDIVINWPYPILVHHYDELAQFRDNAAQKDEKGLCERERRATDDLSLLLQYLDRSIMSEVLQEMERNAKGYHTFEYMWVGLKPGTTVLNKYRESTDFHPGVVHSMGGGSFQFPHTAWTIGTWAMRYNGRYLGRYQHTSEHPKFDGQQKPTFMIVGDLNNGHDLPKRVTDQLNYGEAYWRLLRTQCRQYKGKTQDVPSKEIDGLVMADMKSYYAHTSTKLNLMDTSDCRNWISDCKCEVCKSKMTNKKDSSKIVSLFEDYNYIAIESTTTLTPHQYFLCHFEMPAFVFKTRTWGKFPTGLLSAPANPGLETLHVRDFSEPKFDEGLVNHLVMEPQRKQTLKALAKCFARTDRNGEPLKGEPWTADFIPGKGHGLIFLLHGRPGVGKTYTAECIAAFTKRPLMILTSSDIGTNPAEVEVNLTKHFKAARSWGAVLLIDEADVFMERRSTADLVRNSLVAGFLRALEFYDGILFLTTNRVGSFDDAFISRVHIQLYYPDFDDDQRRQIWQTFIDKLVKERGNYMRLSIDAKDYIRGNEMRALKWNGREIRNAFQTVVSLAEYDAEKGEDGKIIITDEHLRAVVELSRDFKTYLNELHKGDEAKRAERKYERLDSYAHS